MQAASNLENLKVDSPIKKIDFKSEDKENMPVTESSPVPAEVEVKKPETTIEVKQTPTLAETIKQMEAEEPLLQENPNRFVLFPLKYHEIWQSTYTS